MRTLIARPSAIAAVAAIGPAAAGSLLNPALYQVEGCIAPPNAQFDPAGFTRQMTLPASRAARREVLPPEEETAAAQPGAK